jgi:hypothetical protein
LTNPISADNFVFDLPVFLIADLRLPKATLNI